MLNALTAQEFDQGTYIPEVEKLHGLRRTMKQRLADAIKELAFHFNQEERKILADFLEKLPGPSSAIEQSRKAPPFLYKMDP